MYQNFQSYINALPIKFIHHGISLGCIAMVGEKQVWTDGK